MRGGSIDTKISNKVTQLFLFFWSIGYALLSCIGSSPLLAKKLLGDQYFGGNLLDIFGPFGMASFFIGVLMHNNNSIIGERFNAPYLTRCTTHLVI